ncbi:serine hydrolase domain-containing protein [Cryptosporangium phraense]|uniref:Beta-lactamase family protein n=1 Tax=Cryptosporangium phraense TaxID=2593070 RepID=A0A545AVJ7_9ACTN|nr:serine hydrolase domain-containing protein [Cryptosporangium phraense]TQS45359.1 beta-lactamase family protein [Cryptosporangium phraense]
MFAKLAGLVLTAAVGTGVLAAVPAQAAAPTCTPATATAVADYLDHSVPAGLKKAGTPGAVVSVVSGDRTIYRRGFGRADVEKDVPMDPATSGVRIASITKLFTATAVMQQVEAGRLDLDADVNTYLKTFRIPRTYPKPITLRNLLTHTAGFQDQIMGTGARTAEDVPPLGEYLAHHIPARIRPPGVVSAYSNYGAALAGYVVTQVSGEPYDRYVQKHILDPLGMTHTTASEPGPASIVADRAVSYADHQRVPFEFDPMTPDGSITATADDMARFLSAQLNQGRGILSPEAAATLHAKTFAADPRLGGYALGFMNKTWNGHRILMHDGGWEGFLSVLVMIPDCHLGVFLSLNSIEGGESFGDVLNGFVDRFAPGSNPPVTGPSTAAPEPGFYAATRRNASGVEKILTLLNTGRLTVRDDGSVRFRNKTWTPAGRGLYVDDDDHLVAFERDGVRYVGTDGPTFERLGTPSTLPFNLGVLLAFAVLALSALVVPVSGLVRRLRKRTRGSARWRVSRGLAAGSALVGLGFLISLALALFGDVSDYLYGPPLVFELILLLPVLALGLAAGALGTTVWGWRGAGAGVVARVHQVLLLGGLAALAWFCWTWNLIGWQFN